MTNIDNLSASLGRHYVIATDGGCRPNPGEGGWGCIKQLRDATEVLYDATLSGRSADTTNQRMELTAASEGLFNLKEPHLPVLILTDSKYLSDGLTLWLPQWKRNGWRASSGGAVSNQDLWEQLDLRASGLDLRLHWVRGHSGHDLNERAHAAASKARCNPKATTVPDARFAAHGFTLET